MGDAVLSVRLDLLYHRLADFTDSGTEGGWGMNAHAIPRKRRKHPAILESAGPFEKALYDCNYDLAAKIVVRTALMVSGIKMVDYAAFKVGLRMRIMKMKDGGV